MTSSGGTFGAELMTNPERHEVAVLALPHVVAFELGLPHRFLGGAVDADGRPLYRVRTCTVDGGPVRTSATTRCCRTTTRRSCGRPRPS
jgi:transcriptional regulator GlxA family with amidase domain